jgi:AmpD protein
VAIEPHLLIYRSGETVQFVPFDKRAWHAGESRYQGRSSCNDFSLGIELEGTDETPYTDTQYLRLVEITQSLLKTYPRMRPERIVGHSDIAPARKTDPGSSFDWTRYRSLLPNLSKLTYKGDYAHRESGGFRSWVKTRYRDISTVNPYQSCESGRQEE